MRSAFACSLGLSGRGRVKRMGAFERHYLWRPEIQGLRAVGVATVVLFHLWPSLVSGGYVGVDVFFVISGFLITCMLVREAEASGRRKRAQLLFSPH